MALLPSGRPIPQDSVFASPAPPVTGHQPRHRGDGRGKKAQVARENGHRQPEQVADSARGSDQKL